MVGTYHQFGAFVSGVASLPRVVIMTMHDISLKPQRPTRTGRHHRPTRSLELAGTVKTYRYLDEEETAAPGEGRQPTPRQASCTGGAVTCADFSTDFQHAQVAPRADAVHRRAWR